MFLQPICKMEKLLSVLSFYKSVVRGVTCTLMRKNPHFLLSYIFLEYLCRRLQRLSEQNLCWLGLSDIAVKHMLDILKDSQDDYIDSDSCALVSPSIFKEMQSNWCYVCSMISTKRYKLMITSIDHIDTNNVIISETMYFNLQNVFNCEELDEFCFLIPSRDNAVKFAFEARVSLIANPYGCTMETVDYMLEEYFSHPRYLHTNDVFRIDMEEYAEDQFYSSGNSVIPIIYFRVNSLKLDPNSCCSVDGCYVVRGVSTLIQEAQIHSYIPRKYNKATELECPSALREPSDSLISCILPFIKKGIKLCVRPIFLLKGPRGCGKQEVIQIVSEKVGLTLLCVDFADVQALTSAQTEAKLRIVLQNAQRCVPCILYLSNMQVFGKTAEGQKDERVISTFSAEIAALYEKSQQEFPLIIVATSDEIDIPAELQRVFVETIHMKPLDGNKRLELIEWLLLDRNLMTTADLSKTVDLCSDFRFADLLTLSLHAAKVQFRLKKRYDENCSVIVQEDFDEAYEYMQSVYSDSEGAPSVPEVHWDDIGGLAELKDEITRRIQLPLLNAFGFGQSGLLLYGPPGTGKTLLAKAVATEYRLHFLSVKGPEVLNMYVGQSEKNVREIFERARSASPCIIFFDELDSLAPNRGRSGDSGGVMDRVVSQLLAEMDGLEESSGIFILGATNRPDLIDPALLRPGRFDKMLYVGVYSDYASKLSILKAQTRKFIFEEDGDELEQILARLPDNVTGADLYSVSSNAWLNAVRETIAKNEKTDKESSDTYFTEETSEVQNSVTVKLQHFLDAVRDLVPSVSDEEIKRYNEMQTQLLSL